jgi:hypothetical protein
VGFTECLLTASLRERTLVEFHKALCWKSFSGQIPPESAPSMWTRGRKTARFAALNVP